MIASIIVDVCRSGGLILMILGSMLLGAVLVSLVRTIFCSTSKKERDESRQVTMSQMQGMGDMQIIMLTLAELVMAEERLADESLANELRRRAQYLFIK